MTCPYVQLQTGAKPDAAILTTLGQENVLACPVTGASAPVSREHVFESEASSSSACPFSKEGNELLPEESSGGKCPYGFDRVDAASSTRLSDASRMTEWMASFSQSLSSAWKSTLETPAAEAYARGMFMFSDGVRIWEWRRFHDALALANDASKCLEKALGSLAVVEYETVFPSAFISDGSIPVDSSVDVTKLSCTRRVKFVHPKQPFGRSPQWIAMVSDVLEAYGVVSSKLGVWMLTLDAPVSHAVPHLASATAALAVFLPSTVRDPNGSCQQDQSLEDFEQPVQDLKARSLRVHLLQSSSSLLISSQRGMQRIADDRSDSPNVAAAADGDHTFHDAQLCLRWLVRLCEVVSSALNFTKESSLDLAIATGTMARVCGTPEVAKCWLQKAVEILESRVVSRGMPEAAVDRTEQIGISYRDMFSQMIDALPVLSA
eukprot:ANDGO_04306.mRNA.1 hypothetical protein